MIKTCPKLTYAGVVGNFILGNEKNYYAERCRDRFHTATDYKAFSDFYFYSGKGNADYVINFMRLVEQIINISKEDSLEICKTDNEEVIYIKVSEFWKNNIRRSLLTLLLRCGIKYTNTDGKTFQKALYSQSYAKETKEAIDLFLSGSVKIKKGNSKIKSGWWELFQTNKYDPSKILVRTKRKRHDKNNEGQPEIDP